MKLLDSKGNTLCDFRKGTIGEYRDEHGHLIKIHLENVEHNKIIKDLEVSGTVSWEWSIVMGARVKKKILLDIGLTNEQAIKLAYHYTPWHNTDEWYNESWKAKAHNEIPEYLHSHGYLYNSIECKHCKKQIGSKSKEMRIYGN